MDKSEIGILGNSMNELSAKLESTISDLKEANIELKRDIESKEEAEERRKEFLSNVSHELKTPIALIQGYAEGLKEAVNDDAESREFYCDVIMDEARKMNDMVKNILNLSHIESGSDQIEIERFDITQLLEGVIQAKRLLASQKGCEIIYEKTEPQQVWADEGRIEEVVTNYLTNAINHCAYEKKIIVKNFRDGDDIKVTVFNTGDPIPEEELDKIWIKFYKVDKARTREYGGNGIGLSIVKAIMDNHKKECGVENQPDGVMFWFTLDAKA
jgi:signal transduction histidine kinase